MKKNLAWHFVGSILRDGSPIPANGIELYQGPLKLCKSGLHFCRNPFDALQYAQGATLRLVEPRCEILEPAGEDKGCCTARRVIAVMDATELCRYFARMQAINCLDNWLTDPDPIILDWLMTGDESAYSAARLAADSAARLAARLAARNEFTQLVYECFEGYL